MLKRMFLSCYNLLNRFTYLLMDKYFLLNSNLSLNGELYFIKMIYPLFNYGINPNHITYFLKTKYQLFNSNLNLNDESYFLKMIYL